MDVNTINKKRLPGDFQIVARMTGRTREACRTAWTRKIGKPYEEVKKALEAIIENRERLISSSN